MQWLQKGEKPSSFFCDLEKRNYVEKKMMKKLQLPTGTVLNTQKEILQEIRQFYKGLFKTSENIKSIHIPDEILPEVKRTHCPNIGQNIEIEELSIALKNMKNNKSPGIDGISAEFLKVFWNKLKYHHRNAINVCHEKGKLSTSLRQSVISCTPKVIRRENY